MSGFFFLFLSHSGKEGRVQLVGKVDHVLLHEAGRSEAASLGSPESAFPQGAALMDGTEEFRLCVQGGSASRLNSHIAFLSSHLDERRRRPEAHLGHGLPLAAAGQPVET